MANIVADAVRELRAISVKMDTMKTETRRYLEEKDRDMKGIQDRMAVLCTGLEEKDREKKGMQDEIDLLCFRLEEKDREMKSMHDRINLLCTGLMEGDAAVLGGSHAGNGIKRPGGNEQQRHEIMESKCMKLEQRESGFPGGGRGFRFTVVKGFTQVWTDGACTNNGEGDARAGVGVFWGEGHKLNLAQRVAGDKQTNNTAEIQAATLSISQAMGAGITRLQVNTDSQFLVMCVTQWMHKWKQNGWMTATGQKVKNWEDLMELDKLLEQGTIDIKWTHVKGYYDNMGNIAADKLAVKGASFG